uniref:Uncharacterized protein n=1 Tax=Palpitomonas bilix TaxID=652834 RepID=A0A7S3DHV3_9EUKA
MVVNVVTAQVLETLYFEQLGHNLANPYTSFLNDVAYDPINNYLYITDSGIPIPSTTLPPNPGLIAVDLSTKKGKRFLTSALSTNATDMYLKINGVNVTEAAPMKTGADGIALTVDAKFLIFCPLTSTVNYKIPTFILRDWTLGDAEVVASVTKLVDKQFSSDGLAFASNGALLSTSLQRNGVFFSSVDTNDGSLLPIWNGTAYVDILPIVQNTDYMHWPDTIGFSHDGRSFLFVSNQLYLFVQGMLHFDTTVRARSHIQANATSSAYNFRVWKVDIDGGIESALFDNFPSSACSSLDSSSLVWLIPVCLGVAACVAVIIVVLVGKRKRTERKKRSTRSFGLSEGLVQDE